MATFRRKITDYLQPASADHFRGGGDYAPLKSLQLLTPAQGLEANLGSPVEEDTLDLHRASDGETYIPGYDFQEAGQGFKNLRIPAGTELLATWLGTEEAEVVAVPSLYLNGEELPEVEVWNLSGAVRVHHNMASNSLELVIGEKSSALHKPVLPAGWSTGEEVGFYRKGGRVYCEGFCSNPTPDAGGDLLFTLPSNLLPGKEIRLRTVKVLANGAVHSRPGITDVEFDGESFRPLSGIQGGLYPSFYPGTGVYPH